MTTVLCKRFKYSFLGPACAMLAGLLPASTAHTDPLIEEIADPGLPDIAAVHYEPGTSPVILYNPFLCKQAGQALCTFYRFHEYGHIALQHHKRKGLSAKQKEREADRWAAQRAPMTSIVAAWHFFSSGGGSTPIHGDGPTRAARLTEGWLTEVPLLEKKPGS